MPQVVSARVEGRIFGKIALEQTNQAIDKFFSIGVKRIEKALNEGAERAKKEWSSKATGMQMSNEGLSNLSYEAGVKELAIPFELFEPEKIVLDIVDSEYPGNRDVPAAQDFIEPKANNYKKSWIRIFLRAFDFNGTQIVLRFSPGTPFRCVIYHELLHACGDTKDLRGIVDGAIRHSMIGCKAIFALE